MWKDHQAAAAHETGHKAYQDGLQKDHHVAAIHKDGPKAYHDGKWKDHHAAPGGHIGSSKDMKNLKYTSKVQIYLFMFIQKTYSRKVVQNDEVDLLLKGNFKQLYIHVQ
jgi:hypothetical protein